MTSGNPVKWASLMSMGCACSLCCNRACASFCIALFIAFASFLHPLEPSLFTCQRGRRSLHAPLIVSFVDLTLPSQQVAQFSQNDHIVHFWVITRCTALILFRTPSAGLLILSPLKPPSCSRVATIPVCQ